MFFKLKFIFGLPELFFCISGGLNLFSVFFWTNRIPYLKYFPSHCLTDRHKTHVYFKKTSFSKFKNDFIKQVVLIQSVPNWKIVYVCERGFLAQSNEVVSLFLPKQILQIFFFSHKKKISKMLEFCCFFKEKCFLTLNSEKTKNCENTKNVF